MAAKFHLGIDVNAQRVQNVGSPSTGTDAVNRDYADALVRGLSWKEEVVAASTGNISLTGPGTTLDGVTLAVNDRILLKDQTAAAENGIYVWTGGTAALTRALDADSGPELSGATTTVQRGTVNADRVYRSTADDPITVGTTAIPWVQVGGAAAAKTAGNGLTETGTTYDVGAGTGIAVTADAVAIDTTVVVRKIAANSAAATSTDVTHGWGHRDVMVTVWNTATNQQEFPDITLPDLNTARVTFSAPVAAGAYRIVVQG